MSKALVLLFAVISGCIAATGAFTPSLPIPKKTLPTSGASTPAHDPKWMAPRQSYSMTSQAAVVASVPPPKLSKSGKPKRQLSDTPLPRYPTQRGTEVDARKIIATGAGRQHLSHVYIQHVLFATQELADASLHELRHGRVDGGLQFADLAPMSMCDLTRPDNGVIGWMNAHNVSADFHLDTILPPAARRQLLQISTKPGDIVVVASPRGWHLVQIVDVMANVRQMATYTKRRKPGWDNMLLKQQVQKHLRQHYEHPHVDTTADASTYAPLTFKIETMGCQMNLADSERMEGQLQSMGMQATNDTRTADLVLLNTCSIRDHAEQKVYSYLGPYVKRKRAGDDVTIVVAGCVAQQEGQALLRWAPEIDLVMGPQYANRMADLLEDVSNGNQVVATEATHIMEDSTKPRRQSSICAWVNVVYGCNERCTFCIVPTTRGVEQSRPVESIVHEVTDLVAHGYQEVTLLGQNIDAYGRDMMPKRKFSDLIRIVGSVPGLQRVRFVTSHPRYMSLGVVDAVAETPAACECFHIPFQSGSNEVLARMGRGHTREKYLHIIDRIRSRLPDAAITADVIIGFPGETEEQFEETMDLMRTVKFDSVNTAAYSPRPHTPAATWSDQVDDHIKQERLQRIMKLNKKHAHERRQRLLGRTVEILVEERNVKIPSQIMGRTRHGYIVYTEGEIDELRGKLIHVKIDTANIYHLAGRRIDCQGGRIDGHC